MAGQVIKVKDELPIPAENKFEEKRDKVAAEILEEETGEPETTEYEETESPTEDNQSVETQAESDARQKGWKPETEFEGPKEEWIPAEEFIARGPLYETIHKLKRQVKRMEESLQAASDQYSKAEKRVREETIAELKGKLKVAAENNDITAALEIKDRIIEAEKTIPAPSDVSPSHPAFGPWLEKNQWYSNDEILRIAADGLGAKLLKDNPKLPAEDLYEEVSKRIKQEFPNKFPTIKAESKVTTVTTTKRTTANAVPKGKRSLPAYNQLPPDAKVNYRRLVKSERNSHGIITHEQFMRDYTANAGPLEND